MARGLTASPPAPRAHGVDARRHEHGLAVVVPRQPLDAEAVDRREQAAFGESHRTTAEAAAQMSTKRLAVPLVERRQQRRRLDVPDRPRRRPQLRARSADRRRTPAARDCCEDLLIRRTAPERPYPTPRDRFVSAVRSIGARPPAPRHGVASVPAIRSDRSFCQTAQIPLMRLPDLLPRPEHQHAPQQRRPVALPALVLVPALVRNARFSTSSVRCDMASCAKSFSSPRNHSATGIEKPFFLRVSTLARQHALERLLENVLALAVVAASARTESARSAPSACDPAADSGLRASWPCWRDPLSSGCRPPGTSSCRRTESARADRRVGAVVVIAQHVGRIVAVQPLAARRAFNSRCFSAGGQHEMP